VVGPILQGSLPLSPLVWLGWGVGAAAGVPVSGVCRWVGLCVVRGGGFFLFFLLSNNAINFKSWGGKKILDYDK
jgi:hypothetical protein